jgi:hypothetical protein
VKPAVVALLLAAVAGAAEAGPAEWSLALEAGSEYDSNVHRLEIPEGEMVDIAASPLLRAGGRLRTIWARTARQRLRFNGLAGAKLFLGDDGQSENVAVIAGDAAWDQRLRGRSATLSARGSYYDSFALDPSSSLAGRTFGLLGAEGAVVLHGQGSHRLSLAAGGRDFRYKPDPDFDWRGDHYGLRYQTAIWRGDPDQSLDAAAIEIDLEYELERRAYAGRAFTNHCAGDASDPSCFVPTMFARADLHHRAELEVAWTGDRLWSAGYQIEVNDSNSYGQSLVRQRVELGMTTETWAKVFLTARAALQLTSFLDPLLLARDVNAQSFLTIDDENRNSLTLLLARDVTREWTVEARYAIYGNELSDDVSFRRQTAYLGAVYQYDQGRD